MKKMLAKAVALSLVLGGVGFVANNAQAANIGPSVNAYGGTAGFVDVLGYEDGKKINAEVEQNKANIQTNANNIKANADAIKTKADAWDTAKKFAKVQEMFDNQDSKNAELDKKNGEQDAAIEANGQAIAANKGAIKANADAIAANKADADEQHKYLNSRIEHNTACIDNNKVAIAQEKKVREHADQKLQDQITINKGQIVNEASTRAKEDARIEAKFNGEVSRLDSRIDKLDANVEKVGAMAAAIANLHTMGYDPEAPTEIAVGVGQYRDKTGMALGAFHYPNRDFMLSFSVSTAGDEFMGGIGATWKFGRKSPEELRQAEAEKAAKAKLAKAEAAKKAAKDARVAAQQKRHAEMLAARTGK